MGLKKKKPAKRSEVEAESGVMVSGAIGKVANCSAGHESWSMLQMLEERVDKGNVIKHICALDFQRLYCLAVGDDIVIDSGSSMPFVRSPG